MIGLAHGTFYWLCIGVLYTEGSTKDGTSGWAGGARDPETMKPHYILS
jgi:hypothetical protein